MFLFLVFRESQRVFFFFAAAAAATTHTNVCMCCALFFLPPIEQIRDPTLRLPFRIHIVTVFSLHWTFSPISLDNTHFGFRLLNQATSFLSIMLKWRKMLTRTQNINVSQHFNFHEWGSMKANTSIQLDKGRCFIWVALYINDDKWRCKKPLQEYIRLFCMALANQSSYTSLLLQKRFFFDLQICSPPPTTFSISYSNPTPPPTPFWKSRSLSRVDRKFSSQWFIDEFLLNLWAQKLRQLDTLMYYEPSLKSPAVRTRELHVRRESKINYFLLTLRPKTGFKLQKNGLRSNAGKRLSLEKGGYGIFPGVVVVEWNLVQVCCRILSQTIVLQCSGLSTLPGRCPPGQRSFPPSHTWSTSLEVARIHLGSFCKQNCALALPHCSQQPNPDLYSG